MRVKQIAEYFTQIVIIIMFKKYKEKGKSNSTILFIFLCQNFKEWPFRNKINYVKLVAISRTSDTDITILFFVNGISNRNSHFLFSISHLNFWSKIYFDTLSSQITLFRNYLIYSLVESFSKWETVCLLSI